MTNKSCFRATFKIPLKSALSPSMFSWTGVGVFFFLYWLSASIGICLTYHRLLTHRGFKVPKALEYALTACGMLASEGGAITWVAMHRMHHALSDRVPVRRPRLRGRGHGRGASGDGP